MKQEESFGLVPVSLEQETPLFLLIQHHGGHWGFPKGHAEAGETPLNSACREFEEETGIRDYRLADEVPLTEGYTFSRNGQVVTKTVTYYLAFVGSTAVTCQPEEIQNYAWVNFADASKLITFDAARQVLEQAHQRLQAWLPA